MERAILKYKENIKNEGRNGSNEDFRQYLLINNEPDLIIRTSGEIRLSNFMNYQSNRCLLYFEDKMWPDLTFLSLLKYILRYQVDYKNYAKDR